MNTDQKYKLLSMMGYKGPKNESLMSSFIESNPAAGAKMGQFMSASKGFNKGGTVTSGYFDGGQVEQAYRSAFGSVPQGALNTWEREYSRGMSMNDIISKIYGFAGKQAPTQTPAPTPTAQPTVRPTAQPTVRPTAQQPQLKQQGNMWGWQSGGSWVSPLYTSRSAAESWSPTQNTTTPGFPTIGAQPKPNTTGQNTGSTGSVGYQTTTPTQPASTNYQEQINQLYQSILGRPSGQAGLNFYSGLLQSGQIDIAGVEADIRKNASTEQLVKQSYQDILGREADTPGLQYYTQLLNSGQITPEQFRSQLQAAATGQTAAAPGTQTSGPPVTQGQQPTTPGAVIPLRGQTEAEKFQILRNAYRDIFGRNPDQAGMEYYMQQLASGRSQEDILNELIRSEEAQLISNARYAEAQALRNAQQSFLSAAYQSPQDLVTGQEVASMQVREGELVDPLTGQVSGNVGYTPSTISQGQVAQAQVPDDIGTATYEAAQINQELQNTLGDLEAQTAAPSDKATVRGQLEILMEDFEDGTPPWASGAMRQAMAVMQQRGLGASSMAGQAVVQAAMESATAIAQQDANTYATFELRNLDNRQQTAIFKAQQRIAGLFTDQAAVNAARQFNASSENQTRQFMASLQESVSRFNAAQVNAVNEINVNAENAAKQFNSTLTDLRERFNAQNGLVIAQANAQWRQNINTINTAAQNDANREYARQVNTITAASLDQLWQRERDLMTFAYSASESGLDRQLQLLLADRQEALVKWQQEREEDAAKGYVFTRLASDVLFGGGGDGGGLLGGLFG